MWNYGPEIRHFNVEEVTYFHGSDHMLSSLSLFIQSLPRILSSLHDEITLCEIATKMSIDARLDAIISV